MAIYSGYQPTESSSIAMVKLIDSPRNPTGELAMDLEDGSRYVIWDAAYHSPIYNKLFMNIIPTHDIMVGSFGKTTGLTGLRLGWVSTDDDLLAKEIEKSLHADSLGVSQYSQMAAAITLAKLPFDKFSKKAAAMIDDNREEFSKIRKLLHQEVPSTGMFYYAPVSGYLESVFKDMGVGFVSGPTLEGAPGWGRFSLAQKRETVRDFVKELQRRALTRTGAWDISTLMTPVSSQNVSLSKLKDNEIRSRALNICKTSTSFNARFQNVRSSIFPFTGLLEKEEAFPMNK
jgi:aspartate/methionine/tyrosine aminotransferase